MIADLNDMDKRCQQANWSEVVSPPPPPPLIPPLSELVKKLRYSNNGGKEGSYNYLEKGWKLKIRGGGGVVTGGAVLGWELRFRYIPMLWVF